MTNNAPDHLSQLQYSDWEIEIDEQLKAKDKLDFRNTLSEVHFMYKEQELENEPIQKKRKFINRPSIYALAAGIALLIGIAGFLRLYYNADSSNCEDIFQSYYEPYDSDFNTRSNEQVISNLYHAFQAYENKEFFKAVDLFNKVIAEDNTVLMAQFYRGISCIETADYKLALQSFDKILENDANTYYSQSKWYCAMTWLKLNNKEEAIKQLNWLVANDRYYKPKAIEVIKKLK